MRVQVRFEYEERKVASTYRVAVASFVKEAFASASAKFKEELYNNKYKPSCFSLYIPSVKSREKGLIELTGEPLILTYSSSNYEFIMHFCNGVQKIHEYNLSIPVKVSSPYLLPEVKINSISAIYTTQAAVFHRYDAEGKHLEYLEHTDGDFAELVLKQVRGRIKKAFPDTDLEGVNVEWGKTESFPVMHYGDAVKCVKGEFRLTAPAFAQQMFYDNGFGSRTAQGFGMLELRGGL